MDVQPADTAAAPSLVTLDITAGELAEGASAAVYHFQGQLLPTN